MSHYIYCRKSSESEERQILSIESQIKELQEFCERTHVTAAEVITESRSAKQPGRPLFNEMMQKVYRGQVKGIVAWKLDRLSRNPIDGSSLVWALEQGKIDEIVTPHGTFHNNSNDKLMMQIEFGMAKKYVDDLSDNVKRGNKTKLEKGWIPGRAPLGYLNEPQERTIVIDPDRFSIVRRMWDLLLQGISPSRIIKIADKEWGFRTRPDKKTGCKPLSLSGLYHLFANPFYYGLIQRKEGVFAGRHEPMITEEEYWRAQKILGRKGIARPRRHNFALAGLIRCAECGSMITAEEKIKKNGKRYVYYRCTKKKRDVRCRQKFIRENDLEHQVHEILYKIHMPRWFMSMVMECIAKEKGGEQEDIKRSIELTAFQCQKKIDNLTKMRINDLIDDEEYRKEKDILQREKIGLDMKLRSCSEGDSESLKRTIETLTFAGKALERFQSGPPEEKRSIFRQIGSDFSLKDGKLNIEAEKSLLIIGEGLKKVSGEIRRLGLSEFPFMKPKIRLTASQIPAMWALVKDVRTFFREKYLEEISKQDAGSR